MGYPRKLMADSTRVSGASLLLGILLVLSVFLRADFARAQIPGLPEPEPPGVEAASAETGATDEVEVSPTPDAPNGMLRIYYRYLGPGSPYRSLLLTVLTLLVLLRLRSYLGRRIEKELRDRAFDPENVKSFMQVWRGTWKFVIAILVLIAMTGSLRLLGLTAGFIGMMLGWSLQQPVTGLAAWLMIILKKPFRIGDRVIIAGITGDVTAITLTHVILNQVGGSIGGEERSGRGILIPNAILFQHVIINYTLEQKHMLDEVPVRLTFDSDWDLAKKLMISAAGEATRDIIRDTGEQPFIRAEFLDWGILVRLRYQTIPARRQEISTGIIEILLREFSRHYPRVRFANPATTIRYRPDEPENGPGLSGKTPAGAD